MSEKLSERLLEATRFPDGTDIPGYGNPWGADCDLLREAAAALRAVEVAAVADVISGGMMVRPFKQYGRLSLPDDGDNPATREARFLGQFVGQRVALVPLDAAGSAEGRGRADPT